MKRIFRIVISVFFFLVVAGLLVTLLWYASGKRAAAVCEQVDIRIGRDGAIVCLQNQDIENWLAQHGIGMVGKPLARLSASHIEAVLGQNPYVESAQVFFTEDGKCHLLVGQRNPVLKVIGAAQKIYQIDASGVQMPDNPAYPARLRVASGYIPFAPQYGEDVTRIADTVRRSVLKNIYEINRFLMADPFWDAMFEQIYVDKEGEYELVPKVGGQLVRLGKIEGREDLADKMRRLSLFYRYGMGSEGWRKYTVLDLKYKDQLVATRKAGF